MVTLLIRLVEKETTEAKLVGVCRFEGTRASTRVRKLRTDLKNLQPKHENFSSLQRSRIKVIRKADFQLKG